MTQQELGDSPADNYERFFVPYIAAPLATDLIEVAAPARGERALDVGCGTGVVTRLLADRVGASGSVAGLDVNPAMLATARSATRRGVAIAWHEGGAESMPFPDGVFDLVTCQQSLQFIPNKLAALREMRRVLAPGGRLVLNVPGPVPTLFGVLADAVGRNVAREAAEAIQLVFSLHDADELRELATTAGFGEVDVRAATKRLKLPPPAEFLWKWLACTPLAPAIAQAGDACRASLEREAVEGMTPLVSGDHLVLEVRVTTVAAK